MNTPSLDAFARALTEHARRRVVMELTATHPLSTMNELWVRFHGLARPDRPTADDAQEVLEFHRKLPDYAPTPLVKAGDRLWVKDESHRLGLPAFKMLGAAPLPGLGVLLREHLDAGPVERLDRRVG